MVVGQDVWRGWIHPAMLKEGLQFDWEFITGALAILH
jgi:hypothetical protein